MGSSYSIEGVNLKKSFGRRLVFDALSFKFESKGVYGIAGINGSGKSTLAKIIAGIITPSSGKIIHTRAGEIIKQEYLHDYVGFVAPYLVLYDEFTGWENLMLTADIRGIAPNKERIISLLKEFKIYDRKDDQVKTYSSGMKQRLKFTFAFMNTPEIAILDEPVSNLDNEGREVVYNLIKTEAKKSIIIVASNEDSDLALCSSVISIADYKTYGKV